MKIIDIENWNRKEHFNFFSNYDNPFFGIVTEIDCTKAYQNAKKNKLSFFAYYLHKSTLALNTIEELKLRIVDKKVVLFDTIHVSATIGREDGTFGFSFTNFSSDFEIFNENLSKEISSVQSTEGLRFNQDAKRIDVIHYSTVPWNKFTALTHARNFNTGDTIPKITFGKAFMNEGKKILPVSIDVHHGLVDGLHISKYLEEFQKLMNQ